MRVAACRTDIQFPLLILVKQGFILTTRLQALQNSIIQPSLSQRQLLQRAREAIPTARPRGGGHRPHVLLWPKVWLALAATFPHRAACAERLDSRAGVALRSSAGSAGSMVLNIAFYKISVSALTLQVVILYDLDVTVISTVAGNVLPPYVPLGSIR